MAVSTIGGNVLAMGVFTINIDVGSVAANISAEQTFSAPGVRPGDVVFVNTPAIGTAALNAGLGVTGSRVTAADTIGLRFSNNTAGALDPSAAVDYLVLVVRPESGVVTGFTP
jgi:hypothetical protein